ncbi:AI-2E family transporter [Candidatus Woesearchaeota archaeon]|nr:MAG: AI-2E family transporter [Candidatus Woesearchaeota archaeon]
MAEEKTSRLFFFIILLIFLILTFLLIRPFFGYIVLGIILAIICFPVYQWLVRKIKHENTAAGIMIVLILLLIIIPSFLVVNKLVIETKKAVIGFGNEGAFSSAIDNLEEKTGIDIRVYVSNIFLTVKNYIISAAPKLITSIAGILLGIFVMFFIMFYTFKGGNQLLEEFKELLPLKKKYKVKLFSETENVIKGVLYGQVVTAFVQGILGWLVLFIFGVPNHLFWGFIMLILAFLPVVGTPLIFVPAGIYMLLHGNITSGMLILILGFTIVMNIDNYIKPKLISNKTKIPPVVALIGVLGGFAVFGFVGIILGPLIIALFMVLLRFYNEDFKESINE